MAVRGDTDVSPLLLLQIYHYFEMISIAIDDAVDDDDPWMERETQLLMI